jgi:hypothetical protein
MDLDYKLALQDFINFYEASYIPHFLSFFLSCYINIYLPGAVSFVLLPDYL